MKFIQCLSQSAKSRTIFTKINDAAWVLTATVAAAMFVTDTIVGDREMRRMVGGVADDVEEEDEEDGEGVGCCCCCCCC